MDAKWLAFVWLDQLFMRAITYTNCQLKNKQCWFPICTVQVGFFYVGGSIFHSELRTLVAASYVSDLRHSSMIALETVTSVSIRRRRLKRRKRSTHGFWKTSQHATWYHKPFSPSCCAQLIEKRFCCSSLLQRTPPVQLWIVYSDHESPQAKTDRLRYEVITSWTNV